MQVVCLPLTASTYWRNRSGLTTATYLYSKMVIKQKKMYLEWYKSRTFCAIDTYRASDVPVIDNYYYLLVESSKHLLTRCNVQQRGMSEADNSYRCLNGNKVVCLSPTIPTAVEVHRKPMTLFRNKSDNVTYSWLCI